MPRRGENIHKRKDGRWEGRYKAGINARGGTLYRSVYGKTYGETKEKLFQAKQQQMSEYATSKSELKLRHVLNMWMDTNKIRVKPATQYKYQYMIDRHINPQIGDMRMANLSPTVINKFINEKLSDGRLDKSAGLSPSYVRTVTEEYQDGKWYSYKYLINKSLFENDGEYTIVVSSKDKASNDSFSDVKDTSVTFVVDRTAPIVSITGLAEDGSYKTESQEVTLVPTDDGGALKSIVVSLVDDEGNELKVLLNLAGQELEKALEDGEGKLTFEIGEGLNQNVKIVCADYSVDAEGNTNVFTQTISGISVSTSQMLIWWSNKPLRYGVIGGVIVIGIGIIVLVLRKKSKKK